MLEAKDGVTQFMGSRIGASFDPNVGRNSVSTAELQSCAPSCAWAWRSVVGHRDLPAGWRPVALCQLDMRTDCTTRRTPDAVCRCSHGRVDARLESGVHLY